MEPVDLGVLAGWVDRLAAMPSAGTWDRGFTGADGVMRLPWFDHDPELLRFLRDAGAAGFVQPLDWMTWAGTERARELIDDPGSIATATSDELVQLLTTIVRGDRFSEGQIAAAFDRGSLLAIARRAAVLAEAGGS